MSASRQLWGTCPVFQLLLKIPRSLEFALVPRCSSISLVHLSGPGDFLSVRFYVSQKRQAFKSVYHRNSSGKVCLITWLKCPYSFEMCFWTERFQQQSGIFLNPQCCCLNTPHLTPPPDLNCKCVVASHSSLFGTGWFDRSLWGCDGAMPQGLPLTMVSQRLAIPPNLEWYVQRVNGGVAVCVWFFDLKPLLNFKAFSSADGFWIFVSGHHCICCSSLSLGVG